MGIADHLTCLMRTCMWVKKQQLGPDMKQWTGSKLGKEYGKAIYCHLLIKLKSPSHEMLGWMKLKLESRFLGEISLISDVQMTPPLWQKAQSSLKFNIQKAKIIASSSITSWQIDEEAVETVTNYFCGFQNHCRW